MAEWNRIREVFEAALAVSETDRSAFLDGECGDDLELRREVESLLASHDDAGSLLETPFVDSSAPDSDLSAGDTFSHYKILDKIGEGGMGEVFLGLDNSLKRKVALKLLPPNLSKDEERLRRFEQEALTASSLNHPNIVTIHEFSRTDDGKAYIASEFVEGESLTDRIASGEMTLEEKLGIAKQIASALAAAHEAGVIHRDIKPDNIIVRPDGYVKVLDFGIAKFLSNAFPEDPEAETRPMVRTQTGTVIGSAPYMSPEQAKGLEVDHRTDLWSLGVILYEMIAGERPFNGETPTEIISEIIQKEPVPLSVDTRGSTQDVGWLVDFALKKDPFARIRDAAEFEERIAHLLQGREKRGNRHEFQPIAPTIKAFVPQTGSDSDRDTVERQYRSSLVLTLRRYLVPSLLLLVAVSAVAAGAYFYSPFSIFGSPETQGKEREIDSLVVIPFEVQGAEQENTRIASGIAESVTNRMSRIQELKIFPTSAAAEVSIGSSSPTEIGRKLGVDAVLVGRIASAGEMHELQTELIRTADGTQIWGNRFTVTSSSTISIENQIVNEILLRLGQGFEKDLAEENLTDNDEAHRAYLEGRYYITEELSPKGERDRHSKALTAFEKAVHLDEGFAEAWAGLARARLALSEREKNNGKKHSLLQEARSAAEESISLNPNISSSNAAMGLILRNYLSLREAATYLRKAVDLAPHHVDPRLNLSVVLFYLEENAEALEHARIGAKLNPNSAQAQGYYGQALVIDRKYEQGVKQYEKVRTLHPDYGGRTGLHFIALAKLGRCEEAIALLKENERTRIGRDGLSQHGHARSGFWKALCGNHIDANSHLESLRMLSRHQEVWALNFAIIFAGLNDRERAFEWLDRSFENKERSLPGIYDFCFDEISDDPRWKELKNRIRKEWLSK